MRAVKSVSIDSARRVIITYLDGSTETLYPNCIWCDSEALRELIKDLLEEKADAITQTIENATVASFADGADEGLIKKLLVSIEPIQEGSGDPSPENVRPISGRTGVSVVRNGKNLLLVSTETLQKPSYYPGTWEGTTVAEDENAITVTRSSDSGGFGGVVIARIFEAGLYTFSCKAPVTTNLKWFYYGYYANGEFSGQSQLGTVSGSETNVSYTVTIPENTTSVFFKMTGANTDMPLTFSELQLEKGSTATDYEHYKGNTYSVNWESEAGTVYGGTLDVVSGKLTVDRAYIASYNGETLPSTWISDRDVYAEGATPTTGAQVVYKLADPVEYQLTPQEITTLLGTNNIWSDAGSMAVEYPADTKMYIDQKITEAIAAALA